MKQIEIFATNGFSYVVNSNGGLSLAEANQVHIVPAPIAKRAIEVEAALDMRSAEGQAAFAAAKRPSAAQARTKRRWAYFPLGDVMGLQKAVS